MDMHFEGIIFHTYADELARRLGHAYPRFAILDVRSRAEHERSRVPGSKHIGAGTLVRFPEGTDEATEFFVVGTGLGDPEVRRAALALKGLGGRRVVEVTSGFYEWARRGLPLEEGAKAA